MVQINNPCVVTLNFGNDVIFGLGVLISNNIFITAAHLIMHYAHNGFNNFYIKLSMPHNRGPRYEIEEVVINSYNHTDLLERDIDYAVLRVSYFMHNILKFE